MEQKLTSTERAIGIALITILSLAMMSGLISCQNSTKKYRIEYSHGRYDMRDFTDTFTINNGSITYKDEKNRQVTLYGTFSITKNN